MSNPEAGMFESLDMLEGLGDSLSGQPARKSGKCFRSVQKILQLRGGRRGRVAGHWKILFGDTDLFLADK